MSSSPTVPTSTTASSSSSPSAPPETGRAPGGRAPQTPPGDRAPNTSPGGRAAKAPQRLSVVETIGPDRRTALIACGAIAQPAAEVVRRLGWSVDVHPLPPLLHNRPRSIPGEVRRLAAELLPGHDRVAVGYADCGTYGALDEVCADLGLERLPGLHCYDLYAGAARVEQLLDEEPGTYLLTDFLVRSFARTVLRELGLDRWPELRETYFGSYARVVWLAQRPDAELHVLAEDAAARLGLPLEVEVTGDARLADALSALLSPHDVIRTGRPHSHTA